MEPVRELLRLPSPAPKPQSIAFDGTTLWMGSRDTRRIYAIDPATWTARDEGEAPGTPWGMTVVGDELRVLTGEVPGDDRYVRRFVPGHGFHQEPLFAVPEDTGSQLGYDGDRLYVSQWYKRRMLSVDENGTVGSVIDVPHQICGQVIVAGTFYLVCVEDETRGPYWLTRVDARGARPVCDDLAIIPGNPRGLTFDGARFWTNDREADQIVAFARPDS